MATRDEVLAARRRLRELAAVEHLRAVRVDALGTVLVASDERGYAAVRRFAAAAAEVVGVGWVNVVTDDCDYAGQADTELL